MREDTTSHGETSAHEESAANWASAEERYTASESIGFQWRATDRPAFFDLLELAHQINVRGLSPKHARAYLRQSEIPVEHHEGIIGFARGLPLAIRLAAKSARSAGVKNQGPHSATRRFAALLLAERKPTYAAFGETVRRALKSFHRGDVLRSNPLVNHHAVQRRAALHGDVVRAIRHTLTQACTTLGTSGGDAVHVRLLTHTYLAPPRKQLVVAAELGMGYSTYRRHLREALARVVDALWSDNPGSIGAR